jgi:hypothetical protein
MCTIGVAEPLIVPLPPIVISPSRVNPPVNLIDVALITLVLKVSVFGLYVRPPVLYTEPVVLLSPGLVVARSS